MIQIECGKSLLDGLFYATISEKDGLQNFLQWFSVQNGTEKVNAGSQQVQSDRNVRGEQIMNSIVLTSICDTEW